MSSTLAQLCTPIHIISHQSFPPHQKAQGLKHAPETTLQLTRMPSLRDKATRYSSNRHHRDISSSSSFFHYKHHYPSVTTQAKLQRFFPRFLRSKPPPPPSSSSPDNPTIDRRLGSRRSDMPQASEEKVFVTRNKPSRSSTEHTSSPSHTVCLLSQTLVIQI